METTINETMAGYVFAMDHVPHYESDTEITDRENKLFSVYQDYITHILKQDAIGNASALIDEFIVKINKEHGPKTSLRTLIALVINKSHCPHWKAEVVTRFREEGEKARLAAEDTINNSNGQINDLRQTHPLRWYIDYGWGLHMLGEFYSESIEAVEFRIRYEDFIAVYVEGVAPYYDNAYYTTGYNKEVFALDAASTISLLYKDNWRFPRIKEAFKAFWHNVTVTSYDADNSPHYDAATGFHLILNMALRHGLENEVIASTHLKRIMDRMAQTVMSSGQAGKWGTSMETYYRGQLRLSAGEALVWDLKLGYHLWKDPFYLYVARKYEAFYQQQHGLFSPAAYKADLWPPGINCTDVSLAKPEPRHSLSGATERITSLRAYSGLLLGRGDTNYTTVQDKLILSTGHHPRAPYLLMDLSYTQHKAASDHRSGIDLHNYNGTHSVTRIHRWAEANKNNGLYINPSEFAYPSAPYPSKQVAAPGNIEIFRDVMKYDPRFDYIIDSHGAENLSDEAACGFVRYSKYQYSGVSAHRQVVLLHNGIVVISDTISTTAAYARGHNGGVLYQVLPDLKKESGDNWVLLTGQQKQLPFALPVEEKTAVDTLIVFGSIPENATVALTTNEWDPENREWFSANRELVPDNTFTVISLIIPMAETDNVEAFAKGITVQSNNDADSTVQIPYDHQQKLQVQFAGTDLPDFRYVDME